MTYKFKILVVDDEYVNRRLLEKSLLGKYELRCAASAKECLEQVDDFQPDAFLLDVRMPDMDGFELCQRLRENPKFSKSLVIFLSALNSLEQKLKGYEVGADDYVTKPIELEEIDAKLDKLLCRQFFSSKESKEAMSLAMTALKNGSEIGVVKNFFENMSACDTYESLANEVLASVNEFGLSAIIQLRTPSGSVSKSTTGIVNPLEDELLVQAKSADRIYSFGDRCLFNFNHASLLIRRMPEEEDLRGRLRDHLASVMNGVDARMLGLKTELALKAQSGTLVVKALNRTHGALDSILGDFKGHEKNIIDIIQNMLDEMQLAFSYLELNEEQEEYLTEIFNRSMERITLLFSSSVELDRKFERVIADLQGIVAPSKESSKSG